MINNRLKDLNVLIAKMEVTDKENNVFEMDEAFRMFKSLLLQVKKDNGIVYLVANGGSVGIASHFCTDLVKTLQIPANTLFDSNILTCLANDFGYEKCYSYILNILLREQDLLVGISSSGNSKNIINAVEIAHQKQAKIVTLSGFSQYNNLRKMGDLNFWLDKIDYGLVEMGHFFILHTMIDLFPKIKVKKTEFIVVENV